eukprot:COSAG05_NODE_19637_length_290_cov_0.319372_1_plen_70_part_01
MGGWEGFGGCKEGGGRWEEARGYLVGTEICTSIHWWKPHGGGGGGGRGGGGGGVFFKQKTAYEILRSDWS